MYKQGFAICITFPGVESTDVAVAAIKHNLNMINRVSYEADVDYHELYADWLATENHTLVCVLPYGRSVLTPTRQDMQHAISQMDDMVANGDVVL